ALRDEASIRILAVDIVEPALALRAEGGAVNDQRDCDQFQTHERRAGMSSFASLRMTTTLFWRAEGLDEDQASTRIGSKHDARFAVTAGENIRAMSGRSHPRRYRARRIG